PGGAPLRVRAALFPPHACPPPRGRPPLSPPPPPDPPALSSTLPQPTAFSKLLAALVSVDVLAEFPGTAIWSAPQAVIGPIGTIPVTATTMKTAPSRNLLSRERQRPLRHPKSTKPPTRS